MPDEELIGTRSGFVNYYNDNLYYESLNPATPGDVYFGKMNKPFGGKKR